MAKPGFVRVAVSGCSHGELDCLYDTIKQLEAGFEDGHPVELLISCGDFQAVRNEADLECLACPPKYRDVKDFHRYYRGEAVAPVPTVFVGGNHEASNYCRELPYGGWVAPNIWYLGTAGVVQYRGLRIGGVSGIYKRHDYHAGYHERLPYNSSDLHSINHQREYDMWRLYHLPPGSLDVMISHDWPEGVYRHGNTAALLRAKPAFAEDISRSDLGSIPAAQLLGQLQPRFWFSGHLHCKFTAVVPHDGSGGGGADAASSSGSSNASAAAASQQSSPCTRFLALDKPIPGRAFLQVLDIPLPPAAAAAEAASSAALAAAVSAAISASGADSTAAATSSTSAAPPVGVLFGVLSYDPEWISIVARTHPLLPATQRYPRLPQPQPSTPAQVEAIAALLGYATSGYAGAAPGVYPLPPHFMQTVPGYAPQLDPGTGRPLPFRYRPVPPPLPSGNPQTDAFLAMLGLPHVITIPYGSWAYPPRTGAHHCSGGFTGGHHSGQLSGPPLPPLPPPLPAFLGAASATTSSATRLPAPVAGPGVARDPAEISLEADDGHAASAAASAPAIAPVLPASQAVAPVAVAAAYHDPAEIDIE